MRRFFTRGEASSSGGDGGRRNGDGDGNKKTRDILKDKISSKENQKLARDIKTGIYGDFIKKLADPLDRRYNRELEKIETWRSRGY